MSYDNRFRLMWTPFLKKRKSVMTQAVGVVCPTVLGSGGELTLQAGPHKFKGKPSELMRYPIGTRDQTAPAVYLWIIPRPSKPLSCRATWKTPLGYTCRDTFSIAPANPVTSHVLFKTHLDLGYTAPFEDVVRDYQTRLLDKLLDNLDATADRPAGKRFVWTMPTWQLEQCLDEKAVPAEQRKRLEGYIRNGQIVWGLMPFTTHTEFFALEEMCRAMYASRRFAERFDVPVPTATKMTDVPGHTASLAMAFVAAGGKFFQIGTNPECLRPDVPPLFWWDLPDETRILCHYHGTYSTALLPPADWPYKHWLAAQVTSDNVGPQSLAALDQMDWIERHFDWPKCVTGPLQSFGDAIIKDHKNDLPEVEAELTDWWIYGLGSMADATALARRTKHRLPVAETLHSLAAWAKGESVPTETNEQMRAAYEQLALFTEHTWGDAVFDAKDALPRGNFYTSNVFATNNPKPPIDRWVRTWDRKRMFATEAAQQTERIERAAIENCGKAVSGRGSEVGLALFNSLSWARGGLVELADKDLPKGEFELVDPTTGGTVLYHRAKGRISLIAPPVPACGYLVLEVRPVGKRSVPGQHADWDQKNLTLHSEEYTLQFHKKGGLARWHDRARSCQWCSNESEFPMGTYIYEMPGWEKIKEFASRVHTNSWDETPGYFNRREYTEMTQFGPVGGSNAKITPEITPFYARVTVEANCPNRNVPKRRSGDAKKYRTTFTTYRGSRDLHVRVELFGKRATFAAEAGYAVFPISGEEPWVLVDRIAQYLDPADELVDKVNAAHMAVHRGVRVEMSHAGLNFYSLDAPLIGFGKPGAYHFDDDGDYDNGLLYANLFNNCWGTNFAQWQSGDFTYDFVMRPTGNDEWDGSLARGGAEVFQPLQACVIKGASDEPSRSLLKIEPAEVQLITIKPAEFEAGTVIRLWNSDVDDVTATITLPTARRGDRLFACDALERPGRKPIDVSSTGEAKLRFRPNEIKTLLLKERNGR